MNEPIREPEEVRSLRTALSFQEDNVELRRMLADALLRHGLLEPAESEYSAALRRAPDHEALRLGMGEAAFRLGKLDQALVLAESLLDRAAVRARAALLCARALHARGQLARAADLYHRAVSEDPSLADASLRAALSLQLTEFMVEPSSPAERVPAGDLPPPSESPPASAKTGPIGGPGEVQRPRLRFSDVGGMESVKDEIRMKILLPLQHAELFQAYGKRSGGGILLYGPPGCGKTHLARATAGEVGAGFVSVGLHDVLDMYVGQSEKQLHQIFESARANTPCVLFFDEVDALAAKRSDLRQSAGRNVINQFLSELDGVDGSNDGVLVLAATNAPWHLDSAFRRPGRFDQILFVPPPDAEARAAILGVQLAGKPAEDVDLGALAKKTDGFTGADLQSVVERAVEEKLREAMKKGRVESLRTKDLLAAAKSVRPSSKEWFATARNYALYSNQGGMYDDILRFLDR